MDYLDGFVKFKLCESKNLVLQVMKILLFLLFLWYALGK